MATTGMTTSQANTVKKWEKKTWVETYQKTGFGLMVQSGAIFDASADFRGLRGKGDNITFDYVAKLTDVPLGEGATGFGNEESLDIGNHNMSMNLTRVLVSNPNADSIEQQRTNIPFEETAIKLAAGRVAELLDTSCFQQLAGVNPTSFTANGTTYSGDARLQVQGHNAPTDPTTNRIIRAGGAATDQALTSADTFTMDLLDFACEKIEAADQPMEPCSDGYYKLFLHPYQATALKQDSSGKIQWYTNQLAAEQGGKDSFLEMRYSNKPIELGTYGNVKIYTAPRVAIGANSGSNAAITTVRRAVMVGRDALSFASPISSLSANETNVPFKAYAQLSDYDYIKGIDMRGIYGIKKMSPSNADDIGSFVISTYASASA